MDDQPTPTLTWSVCPASLHPKKAVFAWGLIVVVGVLLLFTDLIFGIGAIVILIATQATFLFSTKFSINVDGLKAKYPIQRKHYQWSQVRRVLFGKEGCCFFTRKKSSRLDGFSGLPVFYGNQRNEIEQAIKIYLSDEVVQITSSAESTG